MFITKSMLREYLTYIVPTMITFTLTSIYSIIDGLFVGNVVGDAGLAGINVAFPLVMLTMALGTGIGMGGAVISSIEEGKGDAEQAQRARGTTIALLVIVSIPLTAALLAFAEPLCALLGGTGHTLDQAAAYLSTIAWGAPFQILSMGFLPLIRNKGRVGFAMAVSVTGGVMNVILDYVFVVVLLAGTPGAAAATALSQVLSCVLCVGFFLKKSNRVACRYLRVDGRIAAHAAKLGLAPFGLTILPEVSVVAINVNASIYGGEVAIAAYAVIAYVACVIQMLIQGVGDGSQPMISKHYGAGDYRQVKLLRNTNYLITISLGIIGLACMFALRDVVPIAFGASPDAAVIISFALPVFSMAYVFYGFTHASTSYFYAIDDAKASNIVVYGEAVLIVPCVCALGALFGMDGIWFSVTLVQMVLCVVAATLLRMNHRKNARLAHEANQRRAS